jgi:AAA domain
LKLSDYKPGDRLVMIWKGETGTRKTSQLFDFPGSMFILNFDMDRIGSLAMRTQRTDIDYESFSPYDYIKARASMDRLKQSCPYKTVVLDSYTRLARCCVNDGRTKRGTGDKKIGSINVDTLQDYNAEANAGMQFVDDLLSLSGPKYIILICHVQGTDYDPSGTAIGRSILTGGKKLSAALPTVFNEIYHFHAKPGIDVSKSVNTVSTRSSGLDFARTTLPLEAEYSISEKSLFSQIEESCLKNGIQLIK